MAWNGGHKRFSRGNSQDTSTPISEETRRFSERVQRAAKARRKGWEGAKATGAGRTAVDDAIRQMDEKWGKE